MSCDHDMALGTCPECDDFGRSPERQATEGPVRAAPMPCPATHMVGGTCGECGWDYDRDKALRSSSSEDLGHRERCAFVKRAQACNCGYAK